MHFKKNLVLKNYFPFKGKAYSEDLFHSIELKKKKLNGKYNRIFRTNQKKTKISKLNLRQITPFFLKKMYIITVEIERNKYV